MKTNIIQRRYNILTDFSRVYDFLEETYDVETLNSYLLPQYFEYAHHLLWFDYVRAHKMGLWEDNNEIVGIAAYEMNIGTAHLHTRKGYEFLLPELLDWAEKEITVIENDKHTLKVWITSKEPNKQNLLKERGYNLERSDDVTIFNYKKPFRSRQLPEGFKIIDETEVDYDKLATCYWQGFDNKGAAPENNIDGVIKCCNAPHADMSLATIVVAPNGEYVSALGMWYDKRNKYAYLEPMATIPEYRRMGLGTIALMEAMKKTKELGATYCFGGPVLNFYPVIGFETVCQRELWQKTW